ncbi:MAG: hypothetical protein WCT05_08150, partial [Lentisphaeria bacterium]
FSSGSSPECARSFQLRIRTQNVPGASSSGSAPRMCPELPAPDPPRSRRRKRPPTERQILGLLRLYSFGYGRQSTPMKNQAKSSIRKTTGAA